MMLGVWYPTNYVLAAIDPAKGAAAVKALLAAGLGSNSVHLGNGARVGQIRTAINEQRTPLQRAAATVSRTLTDEGLMSQQYFDEAAVGASLIAVLAPETRLGLDRSAPAPLLHRRPDGPPGQSGSAVRARVGVR